MPATKRKSLCQGKSVSKPNRCKKVRGGKVARGPKRAFCRNAKSRHRRRTVPPATQRSKSKVISHGT